MIKKKFHDIKNYLEFQLFMINIELNICALLSYISKHCQALKYAKKAYLHFTQLLENISVGINKRILHFNEGDMIISEFFYAIYYYIFVPADKSKIYSAIDLDWLKTCSIHEVLMVNQISLDDIKEAFRFNQEISKNLIGKTLVLGICSMYCISTEEKLLSKFSQYIIFRCKFWILKAKNLAKRLIPHSCIMKSIINKYNSLINETERELLDVGDPLNHQKNTKNKRKSKSQIPECSKKRKKLRRNSSRPPSMESDSYFEKSFCIMITSSDLYGSCSSEEIKPDFLFDSFGNKIFI